MAKCHLLIFDNNLLKPLQFAILCFQTRHDKIFNVPDGISKIHVAGDNDIGGESLDRITQKVVSRFSQHFGPINEITELKSFQIVKVGKQL